MNFRKALAKKISEIESLPEIALYKVNCSYSYVIGLTGSPGVGKSTILDKFITVLRELDKTVAVLAIDPSSPLTQGALLGDRIRMNSHATDDGVFIRSMSSRGALGGLAKNLSLIINELDKHKFDIIFIETVGSGQNEVDIKKISDTVIVAQAPGSGDAIQVFKSGIMEIADIFIINKVEQHPASDLLISDIEDMVTNRKNKSWKPIVVKLTQEKRSFFELYEAVVKHRVFGSHNENK